MGAALLPGYLYTFSLQDYIGIIIVFNGAFFWWLALFEGPVDLGRWRKMDLFWGIRLLRKKMQLHTGPPFSFLLPSLFSSRCQSLGTLCITAAMVKQTQQCQQTGTFSLFLTLGISLEKYMNAESAPSLVIRPGVMWLTGPWLFYWMRLILSPTPSLLFGLRLSWMGQFSNVLELVSHWKIHSAI